MTDSILVGNSGGVCSITLNRPHLLNAFDMEMMLALNRALAAAEADAACRAILLTGAGRGFSAGADLQGTRGRDLGDVLQDGFNPLIRAIRGSRLPVVCAVNGVAAGAGANLAFACDIVLAARSSRFIQAFIKVGLVPDAGGTWLLPRLAGDARARAMAMLGDPITGEQAADWGLVWRAVDDEALMPESAALAGRLAQLPTATLGRIKSMFAQAAANTLDQQLDLERDNQRQAGAGADHAEGVAAFLEKRAPVFT